MEIDEALKTIMSLGVVVPHWKKDQMGKLPFGMLSVETTESDQENT